MLRKTVLGAVLLLSACAVDYSKQPAAKIAANVAVKDNAFSNVRNYSAPIIQGGSGLGMHYAAMLVASADKSTGVVEHSLLVNWDYADRRWAFFSSASLLGGIPMQLITADRSVSSCYGQLCSYSESFVVPLPLPLLAGAKNGLQIAFSSNLGQYVVDLPVNYILGYLSGVGEARRR